MRKNTALAIWLCVAPAAMAQGTRSDYERAATLGARLQGKVTGSRIVPHWFDKGEKFWYSLELPGKATEYYVVDARTGSREKRDAKPAEKVEHLSIPIVDSFGEMTVASYQVGIEFVNELDKPLFIHWMDGDESAVEYGQVAPHAARPITTYPGHVWRVTDEDGRRFGYFIVPPEGGQATLTQTMLPKDIPDPAKSIVKADKFRQLFAAGDGRTFPPPPMSYVQTFAGNGQSPVYVPTPYGPPPAITPSPDGKRAIAVTPASGEYRYQWMVESSPTNQLFPKINSLTGFARPGDPITASKVRLVDAEAGRELPIDTKLFSNPYDIVNFRWAPDSSEFTFVYNERGHQALRIVAVDARTGATRTVVENLSKTFVDYRFKYFCCWNDARNEIVWMSERDGWNHLYLIDSKKGEVVNQITKGEWVVRGVDRVDGEKRQIWFRAGGIIPGQDPYHVHFARINFDGTGLVVLTEGDGTHELIHSPDGRYYVDCYSRVDLAPVTELRRSFDGRRIAELERADVTDLKSIGWRPPERFVAKGRDGRTDIYGVIHRPTSFDPARKYPVVEEIYAGPHSASVPKQFTPVMYRIQEIAELGFIVVEIDGMGTSYRSKAFHDVCWKNLADAGFPDRIAWLKAAAAKFPELDLTRVGIFGASAGGQNALGALLFHGDFYKVAFADCGCHDNRLDKLWWNELFMGYPVGPHYAEQSNVTNAHKLTGKLMLCVGELDKNVDPSSTMQVVNALIKADKDFDMLVVPGGGHNIGESPYGRRRRADFFVRHLLGVEPRHE